MDKALPLALTGLFCLLLAACGDEDTGQSRAGAQETVSTEPSDLPTPPTVEPRHTPTRAGESVPSGSPTPSASGPGPTSSLVEEPALPVAEAGDGRASDSPEAAPAEDRQLIRVRRGDLVTSISIHGSTAFPNARTVVFETEGTLERLAVEQGQTVNVGQPLAHMDRATLVALEEALAQARVDALMAREALANTLAPPGPLETARAEARVAEARGALQTAEETLLSLLRPSDREIAAAESVRADTMLKIDALRDEIDSLVSGPDEKELEHLRVHARSDQIVLENALRGESLAAAEWEARIGRASRDVEEAAGEYRAFFLEWLGVEAQDVDASLSPDHLLSQWGADLGSLYGSERGDLRLLPSLPVNDPDTPWNEQTIWAYTHLAPFEVRVSCGRSAPSIVVFCLTEEMEGVWDRLLALSQELQSLSTKAEALAIAHNAVERPGTPWRQTPSELEELLAPADPLLLGSKEKELALAETTLAEVEAHLADLLERRDLGLALNLPLAAPGTGEGIDTTMLDDVSESLRRELLAAQRNIEDALIDLRDAEASLEALGVPSDPALVTLRQAQLAAAELEVESAARRLESATLTSPIAGVVMEISASVGDHVERGAAAMTVVDPTVVELRGAVDEADVLFVQVGASADVHLRALPGRTLPGTISHFSPTANGQPGSVTYGVRIAVKVPTGTELRSGLTAVAEVVVSSEPGVLLIPLLALRGDLDQPAVMAWEDGAMVEKLITTGSSDGLWVVVESGLSEGDIIVMEDVSGAQGSDSGDLRPVRVGGNGS